MGERALAHIEKIIKVYPIEGADNIEMVQVLDFHVVAKKGEFKSDDLVVYVEVDSILPSGLDGLQTALYEDLKKKLKKATGEEIPKIEREMAEIISKSTRPEFEFLRQKKFRIKCLKYNFDNGFGSKIFSQGIIFPTTILQNVLPNYSCEILEGTDVTEILGITKVVEDLEEIDTSEFVVKNKKTKLEIFFDRFFKKKKWYQRLKKEIKGVERKGVWEDWMVAKSDEENIQKTFSKLKEKYGNDNGWVITSKIEGQSSSFYIRTTKKWFGFGQDTHFGVCSRSRHLVTDDGSRFWQTAKELDIEKKLRATGLNVMIQGEHAGGKIQNNIYKLKEHHVYVYRVWDIDNQRVYTFDEMVEFCNKYGFETVPVVDTAFTFPETVQQFLEYSDGIDELVPGVKVMREGIVFQRRDNPNEHGKVKNPKYLLGKKFDITL
jgi:hypothetical protein